MKKFLPVLLAVLLGSAGSLHAALYINNFTTGFANGGIVPDGNTTGWSDTRTLSGITETSILDVNVSLNLSGGYNGDLYVYLTHSSGFSVLLNRVGRTGSDAFGYGDAGMNIVLDDSASNGDIHNYQGVFGYSSLIANGSNWAPDGRNVSPLSVTDASSRARMLNQFDGLDPNGNWTLFIADVSNGERSTVLGWGLTISAVPEPAALGIGAAVLGLLIVLGNRRKSRE